MGKTPKVELSIPIIPDMELAATQTSEVVARHMGLSQEKSDEIKMALIEACINAFEHSESKSEIYIHFLIDDDNLTIKVIDKGKGFDSTNVKIPNIETKLTTSEKKRGWGIMLIKELMDTVNFESDHTGTTLTMTKKKNKK